MKKLILLGLTMGLLVSSLGAPAGAAKKKAKPVAMTMFLHGTDASGEAEYPNGVFKKMDATEPTDATPKSMNATNYGVGPNTACSGNNLLPTWSGALAGTVKGDVKAFINTISAPATTLRFELFADGTGGCDSSLGSTGYVPPAAFATVDVAPGPAETEVLFEDVNFKSFANLVLMVSVEGTGSGGPGQSRLFYDSPEFASRLELSCTPTSGKSC